MIRVVVATAIFLLATPSFATNPAGCWALMSDDTILMRFEITRQHVQWAGKWQRPTRFMSDGDSFSGMTGPVIERTASSTRQVTGGIELQFESPVPGAAPDRFAIRPEGDGGKLEHVAFANEAAPLKRVDCKAKLGGWDVSRTYVRLVNRPTDPEMSAIFAADQAARSGPQAINWKVLEAEDRKRRARTQALLDAGRIQSADDYYRAAFVFHHGREPGDFLKAHALAVIALARGKGDAIWLAAATLDRYLQNVGQPQIFGTQYSNNRGEWTQSPYRPDLLSDALRRASRVPSMAEQQQQLEKYKSQATKTVP